MHSLCVVELHNTVSYTKVLRAAQRFVANLCFSKQIVMTRKSLRIVSAYL
jgi:hypothetical protein